MTSNLPTTIAITGAAGTVGQIVADHLQSVGCRVIPLDVAGANPVDVTSYDDTLAALTGADAVVHLAAINRPDRDDVYESNLAASRTVVRACIELGITRIAQASSINAVGAAFSESPVFDYFPVDLAHDSRPEDPYSRSKLAMEAESDVAVAHHPSLVIVSLRLHAVMRNAHEARLQQARSGDAWGIKGLFGYCTYESVATAFQLALTAPVVGHEVLYVVEPHTFSRTRSRVLARTYYPDVPLRTSLTGHRGFFDTSRTQELLGWRGSTARRQQ